MTTWLTHRSFQTPKWLEYTFAFLGSMSVQGSVIAWVADHRKHHAHADEVGDPHSPHTTHDEGAKGVLQDETWQRTNNFGSSKGTFLYRIHWSWRTIHRDEASSKRLCNLAATSTRVPGASG